MAVGSGTFAFDRILQETSSYYLLGVKPEDTDRDGKPKRLSVKVKQSASTVCADMGDRAESECASSAVGRMSAE